MLSPLVMTRVSESLHVSPGHWSPPHLDLGHLRHEVEYDKCGCRLVSEDGKQLMTLDLNFGQKVKIVASHSHANKVHTLVQQQFCFQLRKLL